MNEQDIVLPKKQRDLTHNTDANQNVALDTDPMLALHHSLTTRQGQLKKNPALSVEEAAREARREYLRRNAARTRLRNKRKLAALQERHATLSQRVRDLTRENEMLRAHLGVFIEQPVPATTTNASSLPIQVPQYQPVATLLDTLNQSRNGNNVRPQFGLPHLTLLGHAPVSQPVSVAPTDLLNDRKMRSSLELLSQASLFAQPSSNTMEQSQRKNNGNGGA